MEPKNTYERTIADLLSGSHIYDFKDSRGLTPLAEGIAWFAAKRANNRPQKVDLQRLYDELAADYEAAKEKWHPPDGTRGQVRACYTAKLAVLKEAIDMLEDGADD